MDKIIALAKRRGFIYPGSEIYGGLAGFWDYGPWGVALKNNLKNLWWQMFVAGREDMFGLDAAQAMAPPVFEASGHLQSFGAEMFKLKVGAEGAAYLRPETAQGIFANFKNVVDSFHPSLPFGIGQIGRAWRNEIAPRDFIFRAREFEQMEVEYFVRPGGWQAAFEAWRQTIHQFILATGINPNLVHELEVPATERAHYSERTIDFEFDFPFGRKELYGLAYRGDYDLKNHARVSGVDLGYLDEASQEKFIPHIVEPSLGLDRTILAVLVSAYAEDELNNEKRFYLKLAPRVAPVKVAVFPLLKNKPELVAKARAVYDNLRSTLQPSSSTLAFDDNGNIGKRYRRQDEIGTPWCVTVDFDTLGETPALRDTVTLRERDTGEQERVPIGELAARLQKFLVL